MKPVKARGALVGQVGTGRYAATAGAGASGIASPLTETDRTRTYHANQTITSSDGMLTFEFAPVHKVSMIDANNAAVQMIYAIPA